MSNGGGDGHSSNNALVRPKKKQNIFSKPTPLYLVL